MNTQTMIKKLRDLPLSTEKIAVQADVSYSWLSKFLLGKFQTPRQRTIDKLEAYLKGWGK